MTGPSRLLLFTSWCVACASQTMPTPAHVTLVTPTATDVGSVASDERASVPRADPRAVYASRLDAFVRKRWSSRANANEHCAVFFVNFDNHMTLWHVRANPIRTSGDDTFDEEALGMLRRLVDERAALPDPPPELVDMFRGKGVELAIGAHAHTDFSQCAAIP